MWDDAENKESNDFAIFKQSKKSYIIYGNIAKLFKKEYFVNNCFYCLKMYLKY